MKKTLLPSIGKTFSNLLKALSIAAFLVFSANEMLYASHISGGEITYECVGGNQYRVTLNLFRDCSGITMSNSETITVNSSCGSQTYTFPLTNPGGTEVSQICPSQIMQSTCNGGNLQGMEMYTYEDTITLTPCINWVISWNTCCRNTTVNVDNSTSAGSYIEATLNNIADSCNASPVFFAQPIPSICINQPYIYNLSVSDSDGDSLVYSFISARGNNSADSLLYISPYSSTNPINGITIDAATGAMYFNPSTLGNFIVVVQVSEYDDSTGMLIGTIMRDIQFSVVTCAGNTPPVDTAGVITNLTGTAVQTGNYSLQICSGGNFSFDISVLDTNSADTVFLTSDIEQILPGATFVADSGNPATATITWADSGTFTGTRSFTITAKDDVCPIPGMRVYLYTVTVIQGTFAVSDAAGICGNISAQLSAGGGSVFNWSTIYGDSIDVGTNFSCNPCANPVATPDTTTAYVVTSDLGGSCTNIDTLVVVVSPDFTYTLSQSATGICMQEDVQFVVTPSAGAFTYQWSPAGVFNDATVNNPIANFSTGGTKTVYFTITNSSGCTKTDSMSVVVSTNLKPDITIVADATVCNGSPSPLNAVITNSIPTSCGLSPGGCAGSPADITVGTGTNVLSNTTYPAPYGNWYYGARHQILYRASELNALGFNGGQITSLAFDVASISGTSAYDGFTISMGCTSLSDLNSNTFQTGLVPVFGPQDINITTGWNTHTFSNGFDWDGNSNIIVEICFYISTGYTNNSPTYYTPTSYTSVLWVNQDANPNICSQSSSAYSPNNTYRPNTKFSVCTGGNGSGYSYTWSPGFGLNDSSIANPTATISSDTSYTVIVLDTIGGCADTASISLTVVPNFTYTTSQSDSVVCLFEDVQFDVTPSPGTYTYQWTPTNILNDSAISNPVATFDSSGTQTVYFTVSSSAGCDKTDSLSVSVGTAASPLASIAADTSVCAGDSTQLTVVISNFDSLSTYSYSWSPSSGLSSDSVSNPFATPTSDTSYTVIVTNDFGGCSDSVSVSLTLASNFTYTKLQSENAVCLFEEVQFVVTPSAGTYTYSWIPSNIFDDNTISNPIATFNTSGNQVVTFTVSNTSGCNKTDTMSVIVSTSAKPDVVVAADTSVCAGGSVQLNAQIVNSAPTSCGLSANGCVGTPSQVTLGTGTNSLSDTEYPAPYGNWYYGARHQILYRASELNAMGFIGGQITSLAFDIESISGTTAYNGFTIKMGCTNLNDLSSNTFQSGLVMVFGPQNINITTGWNTHAFSNGFDWDGNSNIIVEICFYNSSGFTNNSPTYYTPTGFVSVLWVNQDANPNICSENPGFVFSPNNTYRPNTKFSVCSGGNGEGYSYLWSPTAGLDDANIQNPMATISNDTSYTVIVTDTVGGCSDTASINLSVVPNFTYTTSQSDTSVCAGNNVQFNVTPSSGTYTYSWLPSAILNDTSIANPIGTFDSSGIQTVYFTVSSSSGCDKYDSMKVNVGPPAPDVIVTGDTIVCMGDSTQLNALISFPCGISTYACTGTPTQVTVGTGTNLLSDTQYPAPYGNFFMGAKHQLLFTRAELNAMGFSGGQISAIAMEIASISGGTDYENFEIKMGCTSLNALSTFQTGLVTVFPAQTITIITGWNFHNFPNAFNWDGISNLIIEICFNNISASTNAPTYYTTTTNNSVIEYHAFTSTVCSSPLAPTASKNRPNVLFSVCSGASGYAYQWSGDPLSSDTAASPFTQPLNADANYSVTVTDANGCTGTDNVSVLSSPPQFLNLGADASFCDSTVISAPGFSTYLWSNGATTSSIVVTIAGTYSVTVADANGCSNSDSIVLTLDTSTVAQITNAPDSMCVNDNFIALNGTPFGGNWTGSGVTVNGIFNPATAGVGTHAIIYSVSVNNCTVKDTVIIIVDSCLTSINEFGVENLRFNIYPNPNNGKFVVQIMNHSSDCELKITNILGEIVYLSKVKNSVSEIDLRKFGTGVYSLQVMNEKGILTKRVVVE